ncbi:MAG: DUF4249 domain-containing protein [Bacteroidota bacterium]
MNKINKYISSIAFFLLGIGLFTACEDPIDVPSDFEESQLVVDAWLTNVPAPQTIRLSQSIDYFGGGQPPVVSGATVQVCNDSNNECYTFEEVREGEYIWTPGGEQTLGQVGDDFTLSIEVDGNSYTSVTDLSRTTRIDSIGLTFEEESLFFEEGFFAEVYAFDPAGRGDTYWIRAYKNDTLLNRPAENTVAWDATFDNGADIDGTYFIPPIRGSINPLDDDGALVPYLPGDEIYVEVHSISEEAFRFLNIAIEQINNEGIFAVPLANSIGNVTNVASGERVLGIFNIAEVASVQRTVE